ncbi:MAG: hypothetical protein JHC26_11700 [Thermofilum sp.]|jgi:hypothetical protein|uniref:hypothetical protein n=1 Tax=Thermofilum sp. TaxID=1961369 RepID=UPI0025901C17|nr:hypothetical protein [Thermofilum sp.]MCI4409747.1 hypothetical protein [Thermofilum sp.]
MAQDFWDENSYERTKIQEMEKVINLLKKYNIDFTVSGDKVLILGMVRYVDLHSMPAIMISQGDYEIGFDELVNHNKLTVRTPAHSESVVLPKEVYADYDHPFLTIHF